MRIPISTTPGIGNVVDKFMPCLDSYTQLYKDIHQNPELGKQESRTATIVAKHLHSLGFEVHTRIGGYGVVGVLENGPGQCVLLRADMDALPVEEATGLPYASHKHQLNAAGDDVPVMHACGHDIHVACLMAAAQLLHDAKATWTGTLICLFQPNEEGGAGARAMVDDGLYDLISIPDVILGQHVDYRRAGNVALRAGPFMAASDSFLVTIYGRGGHGSQPQFCIDPIVISGYIIVRLQSIVSRLISATDIAVVTVGSIHGGTAENVIPDQVQLKIGIRSYREEIRQRVINAVHDIIRDECRSAHAPQDPDITPIASLPLTDNNVSSTRQVQSALSDFFGDARVEEIELLAGSEDFSNLARPNNTPYCFWFFGGTEPSRWDDAKRDHTVDLLPKNHMATFGPVIEPTMTTGVQALSVAALHYLIK